MVQTESQKNSVAKYVSTHMEMRKDITRRGVAKYYLSNIEKEILSIEGR
jgi:hypothetical protein